MTVVNSIGTSIIRTVVPIIVGAIGGSALKVGLHLDTVLMTDLATTLVGGAYYAVVRWLETRYSSRFGWLLGKASAPKYAEPQPLTPANADSATWV